jgi:hypothetical protein
VLAVISQRPLPDIVSARLACSGQPDPRGKSWRGNCLELMAEQLLPDKAPELEWPLLLVLSNNSGNSLLARHDDTNRRPHAYH